MADMNEMKRKAKDIHADAKEQTDNAGNKIENMKDKAGNRMEEMRSKDETTDTM